MIKLFRDFKARVSEHRLFQPVFQSYLPEYKEVKFSPQQVVIRLLVSSILISWLAFFPIYLFILYMMREKFFSYDFFSEGVFGLNAFVFTVMVMSTLLSVCTYAFIPLTKYGALKYKRGEKVGGFLRTITWCSFLYSIVVHGLFFSFCEEKGNFGYLYFFVGFPLLLCLAISLSIKHSLLQSLQDYRGIVLLMVATVVMPALNSEMVSMLVKPTLRVFKVGGEVPVTISDEKGVTNKGMLILLTPKNVYIRRSELEGPPSGYEVIPVSQKTKISIL